ncbi:MAG TPA: hypothetical protein VFC63_10370 [Blastocatellia bacterium]|nr:hypothetical protein [Blastocatellia bacterium]
MCIQKNHSIEITFSGLIILEYNEMSYVLNAYLVGADGHTPTVNFSGMIAGESYDFNATMDRLKQGIVIDMLNDQGVPMNASAQIHKSNDCQSFEWMLDLTEHHPGFSINRDNLAGIVTVKHGTCYADYVSKTATYHLYLDSGNKEDYVPLGNRALSMAHFIQMHEGQTLSIQGVDLNQHPYHYDTHLTITVSNECNNLNAVDFPDIYNGLNIEPGQSHYQLGVKSIKYGKRHPIHSDLFPCVVVC